MRSENRSNLRPCHVERSRDISDFFRADIERFLTKPVLSEVEGLGMTDD